MPKRCGSISRAISPRAGLKRLFGADSLIEAGKSLAKIGVIGVVLWRVLQADLPGLMTGAYGDPSQLLARAAGPVLHVLLVVLVAQAVIAVVRLSSGCRCATLAACA